MTNVGNASSDTKGAALAKLFKVKSGITAAAQMGNRTDKRAALKGDNISSGIVLRMACRGHTAMVTQSNGLARVTPLALAYV